MNTSHIKLAIKNEIAKILMHSSVGIGKNDLAKKIETTNDKQLMDDCLESMRSIGDIIIKFNRYEITPVGRSNYSDLNTNADNPGNTVKSEVKALGQEETSDPIIHEITAFKTQDGAIHSDINTANLHLLKADIHKKIGEFMQTINAGKYQKGVITSYVMRWELWKAGKLTGQIK